MASQHEEMLYDQSLNRSPTMNARGYNTLGGGIQRQPSRHFDNYGGRQPSLYSPPDDYGSARYDGRLSNRLPPPGSLYQTHYEPATSPWAYHPAGSNLATMGASAAHIKASSRRAPLPNSWIDPASFPSQLPPMHSNTALNGFPGGFGSMYHNGPHVGQAHNSNPPTPALLRHDGNGESEPEELIPTAIVIKNIPFAVKKEQLQNLMQELGLPIPYAFNYHFDNGVFRGLAFANFQNAEDTKEVIDTMNHMDLQGRKLRVEYKKMLPAAERDRIEREKRERRGQLEEQHRPVQAMTNLHNQNSISSLVSALPASSPSPASVRTGQISTHPAMRDVNMNDPQTLEYYSKLLVFKDAPDRKVMIFPSPLSPANRKILHALSHYLGLHHVAVGSGESRHIQIFKEKPNQPNTPDLQNPNYNDLQRRGLMRAATIDFGEARETNYYPLRSQGSGFLGIPGSPGLGIRGQSLREAKSFGDLQNRQPSPALSSSSFPANLTQNVSRYTNEYGAINSSGPSTTEATPTSAGNPILGREEPFLATNFSAMSLGFDRQPRSNGRMGMNGDSHMTSAGAIGSQRPHNGLGGGYEDQSRNGSSAAPERQPLGPGSEWGTNFSRLRQNGHSGRASDETDHHDPDQNSDRNGQSTSRYL